MKTLDPHFNAGEPVILQETTVAILVLTLNQRTLTLRCLQSLSLVTKPTHRIVLWDNGSTDGTAEAVRQAFPEILVHHHPENLGVASGRNAAARLALERLKPEFLLFLDNDMTVTSGFLQPLIAPFQDDPDLGLATGKIRVVSDPDRIYGAGGCRTRFWIGDTRHIGHGETDQGQYDRSRDCLPSGGCLLVRTEVFEELEGFDSGFDPYGPEDLDFGLRARKAGYRARYVPEAVVYHEESPGRTFGAGTYSRQFAAFRAQHWLRFLHRHASAVQKIGFYLVGGPYLLSRVLLRETRKGNLFASLQGLLDGVTRSAGSSSAPSRNR